MSVWSYYTFMQPGLDPTVIPECKLNGCLFRPYFLIVVGFSWLMARIIQIDSMKYARVFLAWVGAMSLEVYLLHSQFIAMARHITNEYGLSKPLVGGMLVILSFLVAWFVHKLNVSATGNIFTRKIR